MPALVEDGDKIILKKNVCYGTAYGLVEVEAGTILTINNRNDSNDGIETEEILTLKNEIGEKQIRIHVWDKEYVNIEKHWK